MGGMSFLQGYTALHLAADRGNIATVELLLKHGADKTLKVSILPVPRIAIHELLFFLVAKGHRWIHGRGSGDDCSTSRHCRVTRAYMSSLWICRKGG